MAAGPGAARRANVRIRGAEAHDAPAVAALLLPFEPPVPGLGSAGRRVDAAGAIEAAAEHLVTTFTKADRFVYVALDSTDPAEPVVGVVVARFDDAGLIAPLPVLTISRLAVSSTQRRRGIGRALLTACIELAEADGVHHLVSVSSPSARDANRYLARVGFVAMATRRMAPVVTVRKALGLPVLGIVDGNPRLARRRLGRRLDRQVRGVAARAADGPIAHSGA